MDERRRQLRREMDTYLSQRRKSEGLSMFKKHSSPALHPAVQPYKKEETMQAPVETEYEKSKKGWFSGFVNKLFGEEQPADEVPQSQVQSQLVPSQEETVNDLKEIARISLSVMKQMPGEIVREFKATPDYEKFKDILRKHKLIR